MYYMCKHVVFTTLLVIINTRLNHGVGHSINHDIITDEVLYGRLDNFDNVVRFSNLTFSPHYVSRKTYDAMIPSVALRYQNWIDDQLTRRKARHVHGPHHRPKKWEKTTRVSYNRESSNEDGGSRKFPKPKYVVSHKGITRALPMNMAEPPPAQAQVIRSSGDVSVVRAGKDGSNDDLKKIQLSPYSLLKQINQYLVPKFKSMNANVSVEVLGRTIEYNDIIMLKATQCLDDKSRFRADDKKYDDSVPDKRIIFIVHGLSVMGFRRLPCLNTIDGLLKLISFYFQHLNQFDIFLILLANPDGLAASDMRPYWNKNMSPQSTCPGVALDRNFDVAWNETHSVISSCSQQFPGDHPFSELESQAVKEVFHKNSHRIYAYFNVHGGTYNEEVFKGDGILYPKGYTSHTSDDDRYIDLKGEIDETMKNASFRVYSIGFDTLFNWYGGKVYGSSVDYASTIYGIPFAFELAMQIYEDDMMVNATEERETAAVLTEVWGRVIHVMLDFIYKSLKSEEKK